MQGHRHAAIMFTDIVGYTALMGEDEERAFEQLKKNRLIHQQLIKKYGGMLIKEMGDGTLASFRLASYAVRCALEIQSETKKQQIQLKIGIHEGEIIYDGRDIFGDGVNIASRLQDITAPGCVSVTGTVYNNIRNKPGLMTKFSGEQTFKNVEEPLKVYTVTDNGSLLQDFVPEGIEKEKKGKRFSITRPFVRLGFLVIPLVAVVIFFLFYGGTSLPFNERDWIVITDFENHTGEPIFDHSLITAFMLSINQSRHINVISRQRMLDALKRMENEDRNHVDEITGHEIALREGAKLCVNPEISRIGDRYILTAEIQEPESKDLLKSAIVYAKDRDDIIEKLDKLSKMVRRDLGESFYKIFRQSKPLPKVTTGSLDALKEYALGIDNHKQLKFDEALMHYQEAIRLDSTFTSAKASLGNLLMERYDQEKGKEWLRNAVVSVDDLTEKEKYGILSFYAVNVENDLDKGIEYTRTLIELFPDDPVPHNNLGWYFQKKGHYERAVEEYKTALHIDPFMTLANGGLNWVYMDYLGLMDSLQVWSEQMISHNPDNPWGYFYLGSSHVGLYELDKAIFSYNEAIKIDPDFSMCAFRLAHVYRIQGMYQKAVSVLNEILRRQPNESMVHYDLGINYGLMGNQEESTTHFLEYRKEAENWPKEYPEDPNSFFYYGILLTRMGEKEKGWEIGRKGFNMDTTRHFEYSQLLTVQGKEQEAISHLDQALRNGYRNLVWIKLHPDLQSLQDDPDFFSMITRYFSQ